MLSCNSSYMSSVRALFRVSIFEEKKQQQKKKKKKNHFNVEGFFFLNVAVQKKL